MFDYLVDNAESVFATGLLHEFVLNYLEELGVEFGVHELIHELTNLEVEFAIVLTHLKQLVHFGLGEGVVVCRSLLQLGPVEFLQFHYFQKGLLGLEHAIQ